MAIEPLLAWRPGYGATPVQAVRVVAGTTLETTQLGAATGLNTTDPDVGADGFCARNRIVEFRSNILSIQNGSTQAGVYILNHGAGTWSQQYAFPNPPNSLDDQSVTGFIPVVVNGVLRLYVFWQQSISSNTRGAYTEDGLVWTPTATFGATNWPQGGFFFDGKIHFGSHTANQANTYDPVLDAWAAVPVIGNNVYFRTGTWINFKGRLLWIGANAVTTRGPMEMKEFVAGSWIDASFSGGANPGGMQGTLVAAQWSACYAFEDNDRLYIVYQELTTNFNDTTNNGQMQVTELIPNGSAAGSSWSENNISSTVVPSDWLTGGAFETAFHSRGALIGYSQLDNTTMVAEHFFWRFREYQTEEQSTFWEWNGNASLMTVSTSDVSRSVCVPSGPDKGGMWRYTDGDYDTHLENPQVSVGKVSFDFRAYTPLDASSPGLKSAKLYYSVGDNDWAEATISTAGGDAPSVVSGADPAPGLSANTLTNITVGSSVFRAVWDSATDVGGSGGEKRRLRLRFF